MITHDDERGVKRQDHYGQGRQPWDDIVDAGWAPQFAAGNVLKYLRRVKQPEHSLESARWYYARLYEMVRGELLPSWVSDESSRSIHIGDARTALGRLYLRLTTDERDILDG